jgi:hypothetical protein
MSGDSLPTARMRKSFNQADALSGPICSVVASLFVMLEVAGSIFLPLTKNV